MIDKLVTDLSAILAGVSTTDRRQFPAVEELVTDVREALHRAQVAGVDTYTKLATSVVKVKVQAMIDGVLTTLPIVGDMRYPDEARAVITVEIPPRHTFTEVKFASEVVEGEPAWNGIGLRFVCPKSGTYTVNNGQPRYIAKGDVVQVPYGSFITCVSADDAVTVVEDVHGG